MSKLSKLRRPQERICIAIGRIWMITKGEEVECVERGGVREGFGRGPRTGEGRQGKEVIGAGPSQKVVER